MQNPPELTPRIQPKETRSGPYLGKCLHARQKFQFLMAMGVFGYPANQHTVCRLMYKTSAMKELKPNPDGGVKILQESIDDATAYLRLDNISRPGKEQKSLIEKEFNYLKMCFTQLFGVSAMLEVADDLLMNGTLLQILNAVNKISITLDWADIDPILALEAFAALRGDSFPIEIEAFSGTRWTKRKAKPPVTPELADPKIDVFSTKSGYRLFVDAKISHEPPVVFEFIASGEAKTDEGKPIRAQHLEHVVRADEGYGPWRVSEPQNTPLEMGETPGKFGFLIIAGLGQALSSLLPEGSNLQCLSDADLRILAQAVMEQATRTSPPIVSLCHYELAMLDEAETHPKSMDV